MFAAEGSETNGCESNWIRSLRAWPWLALKMMLKRISYKLYSFRPLQCGCQSALGAMSARKVVRL